jgi:SAM-dependent methyltransferase
VPIFAELHPGSLLDIPAGGAEYARNLQDSGYRVVCVDLFASGYRKGDRVIRADATQTLPFRDGVFDYVLSREGIEHFENQLAFLRECRRVIRRGGKIVITTPNTSHLSARLSQFLTSQRSLRRGLINEDQSLRDRHGPFFYHGHVFLIDYFRLRYILRIAGFNEIEVFTDRYSPTSIALAPLAIAIRLSMRLTAARAAAANRRKHRKVAASETIDQIIAHVTSPALLFGKRMIVRASAL